MPLMMTRSAIVEEAVALIDLEDFTTGVSMLLGRLYFLNIDFPNQLKHMFELNQKVFVNIDGDSALMLFMG